MKASGGRSSASGFPLVAVAASMWGTSGLFRVGLAASLPATTVVVYEHLVLTLIMVPVLLKISWRKLDTSDLWSLALIGGGASALATGLFTTSFTFGDPNGPILLQKLQPLIAIFGARLLLKERLRPRFGLYAAVAIGAAWLIAFPDPFDLGVEVVSAAALAAGAATLWGMGTVLGRRMSDRLSFVELTAARFGIGLPVGFVFAMMMHQGRTSSLAIDASDVLPLVLLALIPGLFALLLYYKGLRRTPAAAATLAELAFPAAALIVNYVAFGATVTWSQMIGVIVLTATLTMLSSVGQRDARAVGIETSATPR